MSSADRGRAALFGRTAQPGQFVATPLAAGPHSPDLVAGGALCALAATALDDQIVDAGGLGQMRVARVTADFLAPVRRTPIDVRCSAAKSGQRVALHQVEMFDADRLVCRVEVLRLRIGTDAPAGERAWPEREFDHETLAASAPITAWNGGFFGGAAEVRAADGVNGVATGTAYTRMTTPVLEGLTLTPAWAAVAAADNLHGIGRVSASPKIATVNPDISVSLLRSPDDGWIRADIQQAWPGDGTGLSIATLTDGRGAFAVVTQTQVVG